MVGRDPGSLRYVVGGALAAPAEIRLAALVRPVDPAPGLVGPTTREGTMTATQGITRVFMIYNSETLNGRWARYSRRRISAVGEYRWIHEQLPGVCFRSRREVVHALRRKAV
jgi:hypothetical protein